ncbi:hypothetical protein CSC94_02870 [Zhengella mangrovi]|uniref:Uncharacterized protein n=1 Tax=Zhengella mangrovi TaxID=1982044 RepID=A0A2G1QTY1_9HYPH|nr:hypothetical protein [Zhengella mangrovi]PHP68945.1 hypothetical protein CSC94_02870 [Zhengella mangrovi]
MSRPLKPDEARQGERGKPVLKVLAAGLLFAMIAWAGAELYGEHIDSAVDRSADAPISSS